LPRFARVTFFLGTAIVSILPGAPRATVAAGL
jgi:hypothetical protein